MKRINENLTIRPALASDVPVILKFVRELAIYEKLLHEVVATEALFTEYLFGRHPVAEVIIAEWEHKPVGFALFFHNFSTFLGRPGIYLEDLFVLTEMRGRGIGKALLSYLAALTRERHCGRLEWSVLDWNEPAIRFYRSIGAVPMDEWTVQRLTGEALEALAQQSA
ncbi:GNAT family N-acetyltransferase [Pseudohongiella sp.]|uniref:N-acetyltransferase domain-containing protein n=1 Tax=marine sediment metagenome TaxID=412755 RepID=A0A0F9Z0Z2_9ZZZZ|nr:GNAT family N-acetyltransferase [Pseudohongiella sp.]